MRLLVGIFIALTLLPFAFSDEAVKPGETLEALMLSRRTYTSPAQVEVRRAFDDAEKQASDPREKQLIRLVGKVEVCLFSAKGKSNPSQCALKDTKKYGYYSDLAAQVNKRLSAGNPKIGPLVKCGIDELALEGKMSHAEYRECLEREPSK